MEKYRFKALMLRYRFFSLLAKGETFATLGLVVAMVWVLMSFLHDLSKTRGRDRSFLKQGMATSGFRVLPVRDPRS